MWLLLPHRIFDLCIDTVSYYTPSTNRWSKDYQYAFEHVFGFRLFVITSVSTALLLFLYSNLVICTENKVDNSRPTRIHYADSDIIYSRDGAGWHFSSPDCRRLDKSNTLIITGLVNKRKMEAQPSQSPFLNRFIINAMKNWNQFCKVTEFQLCLNPLKSLVVY